MPPQMLRSAGCEFNRWLLAAGGWRLAAPRGRRADAGWHARAGKKPVEKKRASKAAEEEMPELSAEELAAATAMPRPKNKAPTDSHNPVYLQFLATRPAAPDYEEANKVQAAPPRAHWIGTARGLDPRRAASLRGRGTAARGARDAAGRRAWQDAVRGEPKKKDPMADLDWGEVSHFPLPAFPAFPHPSAGF
jgi:hypothetical protein